MNKNPEYIDPTNIRAINEQALGWSSGEEVRPVRIDEVVVAEDAIGALVDAVARRASGGPVMMVCDRVPMRRGNDDLKALVADALAKEVKLTVRRLPDNPADAFHADMAAAKALSGELGGVGAIVSVGSGSVTDVAKYARHLVASKGSAPRFVSFPTAASVTAYTSALAVLTIDGVKRTLDAAAPDAVICDLPTLASAPPPMTQAGFGDVLARSVAYGDWYLANELGMDDGFSEVPGRLLEDAETAMLASAKAVGRGDAPAVRTVMEALLLAGMAMSLVKQTAPVSGWEHVMSHYLDLTAAGDGRGLALHGAQVGVATLVAAKAYERAWGALDADAIMRDIDAAPYLAAADDVFSNYDRTGAMRAEIRRDLEKKLMRWNGARTSRERFVSRMQDGAYDGFLRANVRGSDEVAGALASAGAVATFAGLDPAVSASTALAAVRHSHRIRARFTLGDLLEMSGWLKPERASDLLAVEDRAGANRDAR